METYLIRESARAKHVRLHVSAEEGLVVTVPRGFDRSEIPTILAAKRSWIERSERRIEEERAAVGLNTEDALPERIDLRAIDEDWTVEYCPTSSPWVAAGPLFLPESRPGHLEVRGGVGDPRACGAALRRWVFRKGHAHLVPWLGGLSEETGLGFGRTVVRNPHTRWGSYSRKETVSLNQNLLFLPTHLVRYVLLHELCHSVHLEHSAQFWRLLRDKEPRADALRDELRLAWRYLPDWTTGRQDRAPAGEPAPLPWTG